MKKIFALIVFLGFQSAASADDLFCRLTAYNGQVKEESVSTRERKVFTQLGDYACTAEIEGRTLTAYLYIPILHTDQDIQKGSNDSGSAISLEIPGEGAACTCFIN